MLVESSYSLSLFFYLFSLFSSTTTKSVGELFTHPSHFVVVVVVAKRKEDGRWTMCWFLRAPFPLAKRLYKTTLALLVAAGKARLNVQSHHLCNITHFLSFFLLFNSSSSCSTDIQRKRQANTTTIFQVEEINEPVAFRVSFRFDSVSVTSFIQVIPRNRVPATKCIQFLLLILVSYVLHCLIFILPLNRHFLFFFSIKQTNNWCQRSMYIETYQH